MKQQSRLNLKLKPVLAARLKIAQIFEMPEENLYVMVRDMEKDPLFQKLLQYGAIKRKRIPKIRTYFFSRNLVENIPFEEKMDIPVPDEDIKQLILKIGEENFYRFFLAPEKGFTVNEIMEATGLSELDIKKIINFMDTFFSHSVFAQKTIAVQTSPKISVIAGIDQIGDEIFIVDFTLDMSKGEYKINEELTKKLMPALSSGEQRHMQELLSKLKLINTRRSTIYSVLCILIEKQRDFLISGEDEDLKHLTQSEISETINIDPSVLNRTIKNRAIRILSGDVVPLRKFFIRHTEKLRTLISKISKDYSGKISDYEISHILREKYGIVVSRRTVNYHRHRCKKVS